MRDKLLEVQCAALVIALFAQTMMKSIPREISNILKSFGSGNIQEIPDEDLAALYVSLQWYEIYIDQL